jgi:hypothetical protein
MSGFRRTRVLLFCFMAFLSIVEHFSQIVCGSAGMVALFMLCSQKVPAEFVIRLFHECVVSAVASGILIRCGDRGVASRKLAKLLLSQRAKRN